MFLDLGFPSPGFSVLSDAGSAGFDVWSYCYLNKMHHLAVYDVVRYSASHRTNPVGGMVIIWRNEV